MARFGSFAGPQGGYGVPPNVVHPEDNVITPDKAKAEADLLKSRADELYTDLLNQQRKSRPKTP